MDGTMDASRHRWIAAWPLLDALLPGATLFTLLLWLSWRLGLRQCCVKLLRPRMAFPRAG